MKQKIATTEKAQLPSSSDNLCKRLAEQFPADFARWAFGVTGSIKVDKTELSREPIRADAAIFSHDGLEMLHAEFQTTTKSDIPLPLRMLDYYVGYKRKNPGQRVRQVLIVLLPTAEEVPDRYVDERTVHGYDVIKLWEVDPQVLLQYEGLLPLATLCHAASGEKLLMEVAKRAKRIKSRERQRDVLNASRVFAGLRYDKDLVNRILKESDMLEQSVIYQDILQKGELRGLQKGELRGISLGELKIVLMQLEHRLGVLTRPLRKQIEALPVTQIEALGKAAFDFTSKDDLRRWLKQATR